jgi:hypothetical protein
MTHTRGCGEATLLLENTTREEPISHSTLAHPYFDLFVLRSRKKLEGLVTRPGRIAPRLSKLRRRNSLVQLARQDCYLIS